MQPWQTGIPGAAGRIWEQPIPRALRSCWRAQGGLGLPRTVPKHKEREAWTNTTAQIREWENIPILREADKAVWIQGWESPRPAGPGTAPPSMGIILQNIPSQGCQVLPHHKHSTQIIHVIFLGFLQNQQIFTVLGVRREQESATGNWKGIKTSLRAKH